MLRGLPGSGKTHWALEFLKEHSDWRRVNKDELRRMLWGSSKPKNNERHLDTIQDQIILQLLADGFNVIVDNTHLSPKRESHLRRLIANGKIEVDFEVRKFDTPLFQCILNDASRTEPVGYKVIGRMYQQFMKPSPPEFVDGAEEVYIVDIDGTVALHNGRSPYDYSKLGNDQVHEQVCQIIGALSDTTYEIIFVSGRPDNFREETRNWLNKVGFSGFYDAPLFMRKTGDDRPDTIIKREIYDEHIKGKYNIMGVFDDRFQVVEMWRSLGLTVFHVDYGFF